MKKRIDTTYGNLKIKMNNLVEISKKRNKEEIEKKFHLKNSIMWLL
jgi:hypothetical protein